VSTSAETVAFLPRPKFIKRIIFLAIFVIFVIVALSIISGLLTNYWWFESVNLADIYEIQLSTKIILFLLFGGFCALFTYLNLLVSFNTSITLRVPESHEELVIRYRAFVLAHKQSTFIITSLAFGFLAGSAAIGQWQQWLLFTHSQPFYRSDGEFNLDASFFVFKLPFLQWLSGWLFTTIAILIVLTLLSYYLAGAINFQRTPRFSAGLKAHISFLLGLLALVKGFSYFYVSRPLLDLSTTGVVEGASYTNVHIQIPAIELLSVISLFAALILFLNIYQRGWSYALIALIFWAVISLVAGVIYPAFIQRFKVQPAQSTLELPYIKRNILATRFAYGLNSIKNVPFNGNANVSLTDIFQGATSLADVKLWDPEYTQPTYQKFQATRNFYNITGLSYDRYIINNKEVPVIIGVREINYSQLPSQSWVNQHLQYTHGYGVIISYANQTDYNGNPVFSVGDIPIDSQPGWPTITQPDIYYGLNQTGYVIVDTNQPEFDYLSPNGIPVESHYKGPGGVDIGSFFSKLLFAIRFSDINILTSSLINPHSKILFYRDIQQRISEVAPFLMLDSSPYPVVANGKVYWIQDAYTVSDYYPYSQAVNLANTSVNPNTGLPDQFNYIRNSVKIVINAYTGQIHFYAFDPSDPILKAWESVYPHLFSPMSSMNKQLIAHLRYPEDLFAVQSAMYGRYHITVASSFYNASNAWTVSQAPPAAPQNSSAGGQTYSPINPNGLFSAQYEQIKLPGNQHTHFYLVEPYVPVAQNNSQERQQILSGLLVASCDSPNYGELINYVIPNGNSVNGPAMVSALIDAESQISTEITLLSQQGSTVTLGSVVMVPIGQTLLYFRPLYVASATNPIPTIKYVIAVYQNNVVMEPTLTQAISSVFNIPIEISPSGSSPSTITAQITQEIKSLLSQAQSYYNQAQTDLKNGNLGAYQSDIANMESVINQARQLLSQIPPNKSTSANQPSPANSA